MTLRVGIDYRPALISRSGIGRYVRELVAAVSAGETGDDVFLELYAAMWRRPDIAAGLPASERARLAAGRFPGRLQALLGLPVERWTGPVDVFHATDYVPIVSRARGFVFTAHDLGFIRDPGCHEPRNVRRLTAATDAAVERADVVIAPSRATRDDLREYYGLPEDRVAVAPHGVAASWFAIERDESEHPVILAVGTLEPRKNHARLLRAFEAVRAAGIDVDLVLAGRRGWLCDEVFELLARPSVAPHATWVGELSEDELRRHVARATVFAYPSTLEGFGLPVLEAMAAGVPVLTSDIGATREVAGDAAHGVDPLDVGDIAAGLERLLTDAALRGELARRGRERARAFTWEVSARIHLDCYRRAAP